MKQLTILGSTGSIGCSTLDVVRHNPEHFRVVALVAGKNVTRMVEQCLEFSPRYAVMDDEASAKLLKTMLQQQGSRTEVLSGQQAACDMAALEDVDQVMAAIVGAAGLLPTLAAIRAGKTILLANKESLVTCGRLFMDAVKQSKAQLLPVDSEHNAIFQSLPQPIQHNLGYADLEQNGVVSILLTGSGGPFRETPLRDLATMTPDQACRHPNWSMGRKISVDSATMMNKGLEYIVTPQRQPDGSADSPAVSDSLNGALSGRQCSGAAGGTGYAYANCPHHGMAESRELWREAARFLQTKCVDICRTGL